MTKLNKTKLPCIVGEWGVIESGSYTLLSPYLVG